VTPVPPRPAASVLLVRAGRRAPVEVYMIRRQKSMRFLGGFYAFPGGGVDPGDATPEIFSRCRGIVPADADRALTSLDDLPAWSFWVAAARELLEETGVLVAHDAHGPIDARDHGVRERVAATRGALMSGDETFSALLAREDWHLDLARFRYLSHFITPPSSPIRFSARFFLAAVPDGQEVRLFEEEASEGFWIEPAEGFRRFSQGDMPMAEPAYSGLAYLGAFDSLAALWAAHADGRHKFHGINDRLDAVGLRVPRRPPAGPPAPSAS
jgi:8-oxo-dGTP pyrophosphatase MutT (NUDIX family)